VAWEREYNYIGTSQSTGAIGEGRRTVSTAVPYIGGGVIFVLVVMVLLFKAMWRVAEPNQALIISGRRHRGLPNGPEVLGFRVVTGGGSFVIPGVQVVRRLSLDLNEAELVVECVTRQGIPLHLKGVVIFKVGDDHTSIANAARRFLDQQSQMGTRVHNIFAGHLRSIAGGLTVEEMIRDRERLTEQTRATSGTEMEKLGLVKASSPTNSVLRTFPHQRFRACVMV
jgi:flotillin